MALNLRMRGKKSMFFKMYKTQEVKKDNYIIFLYNLAGMRRIVLE